MPDESLRRAEARHAIDSGKLPRSEPDRTWGGPGGGASCSVCANPVTAQQMEYEVEFVRPDGLGRVKYHLHLRCFAVWELERTKDGDGSALPQPTPPRRPPGK
jgi:hypothetical protein